MDSEDELGASAAAFNGLLEAVYRSRLAEVELRDYLRELSAHLELEDLGPTALDGIVRIGGFAGGALVVDVDGETQAVASRAIPDTTPLATTEHVRRALRTGAPEVVEIPPDVRIDGALVAFAVRAVHVLPVTFKGVVLGVLVLAASEPTDPERDRLVATCASNLGLALNNALTHHRLARVAALDPLTDSLNRRFGLVRLQEEFSRAVRAETPLGAFMIDLDHFKAVNDTYGHPVGDKVLRAAARAARRVIREGDVLVRYGGEEFLVILPGASRADLAEVGERADSALYAAKESGRDRVVIDGARPAAT